MAGQLDTTVGSPTYGQLLAVAPNQTVNTTPGINYGMVSTTPSPITPSSMQPASPTPVPPAVPQNSAAADAIISKAGASVSDYQQALATPPTATENKNQDLLNTIASLTGDLSSKGADQLAAEQAAGLSGMKSQITDINSQISQKLAEAKAFEDNYTKASHALEGQGRGITLSDITGQQGVMQRALQDQKNSLASDVGILQARGLALQQQYTDAQDTVNRAVDLKYQTKLDEIKSYQAQLDALKPTLDKESQAKAEAMTLWNQDRLQKVQDAQQNDKNIQSIILEYAKNGASPELLAQMSKAKTPLDVMKIGGSLQPKDFSVVKGGTYTDENGNQQDLMVRFDKNTGSYSPIGSTNPAGQEVSNNGMVTTSTGQVFFNGDGSNKSYATNPQDTASVQRILTNMGQMTSIPQMDAYIKQVAPNSPITGQMVANASGKYGVPWEMILARMQQDSHFADPNMGKNGQHIADSRVGIDSQRAFMTNNPGNVNNVDSGSNQKFASWQDGVNAVAKWYATNGTKNVTQQTVNPVAQSWANNILTNPDKFKMSDVPKGLQSQVSMIIDSSRTPPSEILTTTKASLDELNNMVINDHGFKAAVGVKSISGAGLLGAVGQFFGYKGQPVAGSQAAAFVSKLNQVKNDVILPNLSMLRGVGRITDREFQALSEAVTSLNTDLSEEDFKTELKNITDRIDAKIGTTPNLVDVGGQKYAPGTIIQNSQGQQGRVNEDGTITPQ